MIVGSMGRWLGGRWIGGSVGKWWVVGGFNKTQTKPAKNCPRTAYFRLPVAFHVVSVVYDKIIFHIELNISVVGIVRVDNVSA